MKNRVYSKFSYAFSANLISIIISVIMITVIPKFLSVNDYGAWQLFLFYLSYVGFMHFGWEDGIYLRYAGLDYSLLDRRCFAGQIYAIILLQITLGFSFYLLARCLTLDPTKVQISGYVGIAMVFINFINCANFILQITSRIKNYAFLILVERLALVIGVCFILFIGGRSYDSLVYCKLLSLFIATCLASYSIKELLYFHVNSIGSIVKEAIININVGSKLMLANIASMLILGIVRYGISEGWNIATFGKVSLTLGISNFLMVFISAVSVVFFPILKHLNESKLGPLYLKVRKVLSATLLGLLLAYYPIKVIMSMWLPRYVDALIYMAILFPICLFESRVSLLINTYLKSMRQEKLMLKINACAVILSVLVTYIGVIVLHNLNFVILSIVALFAFRSTLAEYWLSKLLSIDLRKDIVIDLLIATIFIVCSWTLPWYQSMPLYLIVYASYIWNSKAELLLCFKEFKSSDM